MDTITRRRFVKALGAGGLAYAFGRTPGTVWAQSSSVAGYADYKSLVCVFLYGGNDSWNTLVPRSTAEYSAYATSRKGLAVQRDALLAINAQGSPAGAYGFHPSMSGMQRLFESGRCAVVANIGPLPEPVTKEQYRAGTAQLPPHLFSHNDQQNQWHTLRGRSNLKTGWAGRIADLLAAQAGGTIPFNISLAGSSPFQAADSVMPYVMGAAGPQAYQSIGTQTQRDLTRRAAFLGLVESSHDSVYARHYAQVQMNALYYAEVTNAALAQAPVLTTTFPTNSSLATQLRTVARLISVREALGHTRQIFFVAAGGFDTHSAQLVDQPRLLADVSTSLTSFYNATVELGTATSVTTFTQSDFGRSLTSNGDGSDHAWGGVQFVIGGSVSGQRIYGNYPVLALDGSLDVGGGRLIPTLSSDQYSATLARWLGIAEENLPTVAPSLANFAVRDLGFLV